MVTGIGAVTPIGHTAGGLWEAMLRPRSAVRAITHFDASPFSSRIAAEIPDFDPLRWIDPRTARRLDRCSQLALAASLSAVADAGLQPDLEDGSRGGVFIGSALGGAAFAEEQHARYMEAGDHAVAPHLALQMFVGAGGCNTAIALGFTGCCTANADSCASGTVAIGNGLRAIQRGDIDLAVCGGAEAPLAPLCFGAFARIRALSTRNAEPERACRPFDSQRDGFVMAEGSAVLLLESWEHAQHRGARAYAEVAGFAVTNDAHDMTAPRPDAASAARCISLALDDACLPPQAIGYVNAHGSSTRLNDPVETLAIKQALGSHALRVPISGTKAMHGHALGATGAIEAAICCLAVSRGYVPPTLNLEALDPDCDLDYVPHAGREVRIGAVLSNSFGFGGINACLVLRHA